MADSTLTGQEIEWLGTFFVLLVIFNGFFFLGSGSGALGDTGVNSSDVPNASDYDFASAVPGVGSPPTLGPEPTATGALGWSNPQSLGSVNGNTITSVIGPHQHDRTERVTINGTRYPVSFTDASAFQPTAPVGISVLDTVNGTVESGETINLSARDRNYVWFNPEGETPRVTLSYEAGNQDGKTDLEAEPLDPEMIDTVTLGPNNQNASLTVEVANSTIPLRVNVTRVDNGSAIEFRHRQYQPLQTYGADSPFVVGYIYGDGSEGDNKEANVVVDGSQVKLDAIGNETGGTLDYRVNPVQQGILSGVINAITFIGSVLVYIPLAIASGIGKVAAALVGVGAFIVTIFTLFGQLLIGVLTAGTNAGLIAGLLIAVINVVFVAYLFNIVLKFTNSIPFT